MRRHVDVGDDDIGPQFLGRIDQRLTVGDGSHDIETALEQADQSLGENLVIVGNQYRW